MRLETFSGQERFTGDATVAELVAGSAIDAVVGVGTPVAPQDVVETAGFLRPGVQDGLVVLLVEPLGPPASARSR